jgi:hypothetical protein
MRYPASSKHQANAHGADDPGTAQMMTLGLFFVNGIPRVFRPFADSRGLLLNARPLPVNPSALWLIF